MVEKQKADRAHKISLSKTFHWFATNCGIKIN